jgi:hypothetical protein
MPAFAPPPEVAPELSDTPEPGAPLLPESSAASASPDMSEPGAPSLPESSAAPAFVSPACSHAGIAARAGGKRIFASETGCIAGA